MYQCLLDNHNSEVTGSSNEIFSKLIANQLERLPPHEKQKYLQVIIQILYEPYNSWIGENDTKAINHFDILDNILFYVVPSQFIFYVLCPRFNSNSIVMFKMGRNISDSLLHIYIIIYFAITRKRYYMFWYNDRLYHIFYNKEEIYDRKYFLFVFILKIYYTYIYIYIRFRISLISLFTHF